MDRNLLWLGLLLLRPSSPRARISSLLLSSAHAGGGCKIVRQGDGRFIIVSRNDRWISSYCHFKDVENILSLVFVTMKSLQD
jgi:hypothetical protein